jgi:hypothetical protein
MCLRKSKNNLCKCCKQCKTNLQQKTKISTSLHFQRNLNNVRSQNTFLLTPTTIYAFANSRFGTSVIILAHAHTRFHALKCSSQCPCHTASLHAHTHAHAHAYALAHIDSCFHAQMLIPMPQSHRQPPCPRPCPRFYAH